MAPSVAQLQPTVLTIENDTQGVKSVQKSKTEEVIKEKDKGPSFPFYLPYFDRNEKWSPLEIFEHVDPGSRADPKKPHLLTPNTKTVDLSPYLGTEVIGVQISQLSAKGLDELALYVAERKVVIFRDQDFKDIGPDRQIEIARYFGPIQRHPTCANVKGYPEFHVVYRDEENDLFKASAGTNTIYHLQWHSDVSFELQPPGTTIFCILDHPEVGGGDTIFLSQVEAYNRLSPEFQKRLEGLRAIHTSFPLAEFANAHGDPIRRDPIETEHPVVRVHPVTREKALYVNRGFTKCIAGFREEESDYLLNFLYDHISKGSDFQIRARYEPGTVVIWDNRVTCHTTTRDYSPKYRRHAFRLTPQAEVPIEARVN